jgi:ubiquinone/menaquinone biosynthesis C-methylase UbiE
MSIFRKLNDFLSPPKPRKAAEAYDLWSGEYDNQPGNLMLMLDEKLVAGMLATTDLQGKNVVDIGCGTGRHWEKFFSQSPASLDGFDVSRGMLQKLKDKFPQAHVNLVRDEKLPQLEDESCDLVFSTLTIAHLEDLENAFREWDRVLRRGGDVFMTDYHPAALDEGGQRTFRHAGKLLSVKNYIHTIDDIIALAGQLHWEVIRLEEARVDDTMRSWYEAQNALAVFEKFNGLPIIYGLHLKKQA